MDPSDLFPIRFRCDIPGSSEPFALNISSARLAAILSSLGWKSSDPSPEAAQSLSLCSSISDLFRDLAERALWSQNLECHSFRRRFPRRLESIPRYPDPSLPEDGPDLWLGATPSPNPFKAKPRAPASPSAIRAALAEAFSRFAPSEELSPQAPDPLLANGACFSLRSRDPASDRETILLAAFSPSAAAALMALPGAYRSDTLGSALGLLPELAAQGPSGKSWTLYPGPFRENASPQEPFPRIGLSLLRPLAPLSESLAVLERAAGERALWTREWAPSSDFGFSEDSAAHLAAWEAICLSRAPAPSSPRREASRRL